MSADTLVLPPCRRRRACAAWRSSSQRSSGKLMLFETILSPSVLAGSETVVGDGRVGIPVGSGGDFVDGWCASRCFPTARLLPSRRRDGLVVILLLYERVP